jgi:hypothetical protein
VGCAGCRGSRRWRRGSWLKRGVSQKWERWKVVRGELADLMVTMTTSSWSAKNWPLYAGRAELPAI